MPGRAKTNVYCGLTAASPQDVSKRPTTPNREETGFRNSGEANAG